MGELLLKDIKEEFFILASVRVPEESDSLFKWREFNKGATYIRVDMAK